MKYCQTTTTPIDLTGEFLTPKGAYILTNTSYDARVVTKEGEYELTNTDVVVAAQPTPITNGKLTVTYSIPASARGGIVSISLYHGSPASRVGSIQFYLLDGDGGNGVLEYTTTSTTSISTQ